MVDVKARFAEHLRKSSGDKKEEEASPNDAEALAQQASDALGQLQEALAGLAELAAQAQGEAPEAGTK